MAKKSFVIELLENTRTNKLFLLLIVYKYIFF